MNIFHFLTIVLIWVIGYAADSLFLSFIAMLFVLSHASSESSNDEDDEDEDDEDWDDYDLPCEDEPSCVVSTPSVTTGPVFPDFVVADKHIHYLEEQDSIIVFSYNSSEGSWTKIGEMAYQEGQKPEVVATVVLEK